MVVEAEEKAEREEGEIERRKRAMSEFAKGAFSEQKRKIEHKITSSDEVAPRLSCSSVTFMEVGDILFMISTCFNAQGDPFALNFSIISSTVDASNISSISVCWSWMVTKLN